MSGDAKQPATTQENSAVDTKVKEAPITAMSMIEGDSHVWYLTRALNEPGKDVAYVLYVFGDGGGCEILDGIDYAGERAGSYVSVGTFGDVEGYADEELVSSLCDFQTNGSGAHGYYVDCPVHVGLETDQTGNNTVKEKVWLEGPDGDEVGDFEIEGPARRVFTVYDSYYAGFSCADGRYLVRRYGSYNEAAAASFSLDQPTHGDEQWVYEGRPDYPALAGSGGDGENITSNGTAVDEIREFAKRQTEELADQ